MDETLGTFQLISPQHFIVDAIITTWCNMMTRLPLVVALVSSDKVATTAKDKNNVHFLNLFLMAIQYLLIIQLCCTTSMVVGI